VRLLAAVLAGASAYLAAGLVTGTAPELSWKVRPRVTSRSAGRLWLTQAGLHVSVPQFWAASALAGLVGLAIGLGITGAIWVALPPAVAFAVLPRWYYSRRRLRRLAEVQQAWPDGLRHLVASVRSGRSLGAALDDLAVSGPDGLREVLGRYPVLARMLGPVPALHAVRDDVADPTTDRIVEVLVLAFERGGSIVPDILHDLAEATTNDLRTLEEIRSNALEQRINARIVFAIPWFVLLLLTARQGEYRDFYRSPQGLAVVVIAAIASLIGALWIARLGRDAVEPRVFGGEVTRSGA
jgi:tight adherence protein B